MNLPSERLEALENELRDERNGFSRVRWRGWTLSSIKPLGWAAFLTPEREPTAGAVRVRAGGG
ncbi:MAG TPA: hypothetical protein VEH29_08410 [Acidimicrobiales bacterium]|nr:hypothetical protein [Acidimicrobiales bacterium]